MSMEKNEVKTSHKFVKLERIYLKDLSFESPKGPIYLPGGASPKTELNLRSSSNRIKDSLYEVSLTLTIKAIYESETIFIVELTQSGSFHIAGYDSEELKAILGAFAVSQIYPFARESVSHIVAAGGFPPFFLQPINFDTLYNRSISQDEMPNKNIKVH